MKKNLLIPGLLFFLLTLNNQLFAQITLEADTLVTEVIESDDIVAHNTFTNVLPQQKTIKWTRNVIEMTDGWTTAICDENGCYIPTVDEAEIELGPNVSSRLDVHLYPNGIYEGYAFLEVNVAHANNPNNNIFAYFVYDSALSTSTKNIPNFTFQVYPNPSTGLFNLENPDAAVASVKVNAMSGKEMLNLRIGERQWMDLGKLPSGMYMLQLLDEKGFLLETKLVNKI